MKCYNCFLVFSLFFSQSKSTSHFVFFLASSYPHMYTNIHMNTQTHIYTYFNIIYKFLPYLYHLRIFYHFMLSNHLSNSLSLVLSPPHLLHCFSFCQLLFLDCISQLLTPKRLSPLLLPHCSFVFHLLIIIL